MNIELYLNRIGYSGSVNPTLDVLIGLQNAHLLNIPFENLDIHYGVPIELDIHKLYNKIILKQRGGFCYELNGLFYELLTHLGFSAKRISARVYDKMDGYGKDFDHLAIIVSINGVEYLSDVGFGEFAFAPLKIETGIIQHDKRGDYVLHRYEDNYYRVSKLENDTWIPEYIFINTGRALNEFHEMCIYHQTSPKSHFTQKILITRPTQNGRITISGNTLRIKNGNAITETYLENEEAFKAILLKYFRIALDTHKPSR